MTVKRRAREVILGKIDKMEGSGGGVICVDKNGNIAMEFNTGHDVSRMGNCLSGQKGTAIE
jgi:isoaspartyl peptidase/L-asparaginase-like protein (Ntn-hydrolase superfamily)